MEPISRVYRMNEASFALPAASLVDRTVTVVDAMAEDGLPQTILVHRSEMPDGETLAGLAAGSHRDASLRLTEHAPLFTRALSIAGAPAIEQGARWRGREGIVYTRLAHLDVRGAWIVLAASCALDDRARCDAVMDHVLATFRVRA